MSIHWERDIVQRTVEGAGPYAAVQLRFLLERLEAHPETVPAIAAAIRDLGAWMHDHADALEAEAGA